MDRSIYGISLSQGLKAGVFFVFFTAYLGHSAAGWRTALMPAHGWAEPPRQPPTVHLSLFETDVWTESAEDGSLSPWPKFPMQRHREGVLNGAHFTPQVYLSEVQDFLEERPGRCDVLMYYGGRPHGTERQGLNLNSWTPEELHQLHDAGGRPFIGLETMDPVLVFAMVDALNSGGFRGSRLYVRIGAEPSGMFYGTLDGTPRGRRHTAACYAAYHKRFLKTAQLLRKLGRHYGIQFLIVFAGDSKEDFDHYIPDPGQLDAVGFDLYVTPANIHHTLPLLQRVMRRFPDKPIVIPELGIATSGETTTPGYRGVRASPAWAKAALAEVLTLLGRHPGHVTQMTLFSVDVAGRLDSRHWSWAWTPAMFDMLEEWQQAPARWAKKGFHRYDLRSYPVGKDILYRSGRNYRLVYRKLTEATDTQPATFLETAYVLRHSEWERVRRQVGFNNGLIENIHPVIE